jgi:hypothetical protein
VMATVAILEAGTYAYMAWRYETPVSVVAWALILSRALAAPLLSVYLAMARPLPVTARDILAQVELASGLGLIRDAVTIANDAGASLSQKVALFGASAVMRRRIANDSMACLRRLSASMARRSPSRQRRRLRAPCEMVSSRRAAKTVRGRKRALSHSPSPSAARAGGGGAHPVVSHACFHLHPGRTDASARRAPRISAPTRYHTA